MIYTYYILVQVSQCGLTEFNKVTTSDYRGFCLDITKDSIFDKQETTAPSPSNRKLSSKHTRADNKYQNHLQKKKINKI